MSSPAICETAYAKLNLVLHVGPPRADGLHPLCSLFASLDLADEIEVTPRKTGEDDVECPGVDGPNLAAAALAAFRARRPELPPLHVRIDKRIPVAAGLGGGSADAAAALRAANRLSTEDERGPLEPAALRELAAGLGSDVPSQLDPRHALVQGAGELVEPIELPPLAALLVPQAEGLSTGDVYAQLDRMQRWRERLDPAPLRALAARSAAAGGAAGAAATLAAALENDLQPATLALRPELSAALEALEQAGAHGALVSGSGPSCFGLFEHRAGAEAAATRFENARVAELRQPRGH